MEPLQLKVGADISDLEKGLDDARKELAQTATAAAKLDSSLGKSAPGAARAGAALTDFGRIAQDAAFGPIAIANNIVPLVESLGRLKAETGSSGGAFKALFSSLAGGGGLIFAFSAVTAAIGFASMGLDAWTRGFGGAKKGAEEAKKATDNYSSAIKGIGEGLAKEAVQVAVLVKAIQGETLSRNQKVKAIEELKRVSPDYFGQLKVEDGLIQKLEASYRNYLSAIKDKFAVKALDVQLESLFNRKLDLSIQLDKTAFNAIDKETSNQINRLNARIEALGGIKILPEDVTQELTAAQQQVFELQRAINNLATKNKFDLISDNKTSNELNNVNKEIDGLLSRRALLGNFDITPVKDPEKKAKDVKKISDVIAELNKDLDTLASKQLIGVITPDERDVSAVKLYEKAFSDLFDLKLDPNSPLAKGLAVKFDAEKTQVSLTELLKKIAKSDKSTVLMEAVTPVKSSVDPTAFGKTKGVLSDIIKLQDEYANKVNTIADAVQDTLGGAFQSTFEAIANGGQNALAVFGKAIKQVIVRLAAAAATAALLAAIIGAVTGGASFGGGAGAFAGGFKSLFSKLAGLPKFADGVTNFRGGVAMVGERGPELVRLPGGSDVIPNHALGAFGGNTNFSVSHTIRGSELLLLIDRAEGRRGRNG